VDVGEGDAGAALGQDLGHREPEPGRRAGDDDARSGHVEELRKGLGRAHRRIEAQLQNQ
jgi:hypothetical protein